MAKLNVIWSNRAKIKRFEILSFYNVRNKSKEFPKKLNQRINREIKLLSKSPNIGIRTDIENVRGLIIDNIILYYEVVQNTIIILFLWDSRQNPKDLKIK